MEKETLSGDELDANVTNVAATALRRDGKHATARRFEAVRDGKTGARLDKTDLVLARRAVLRTTENESVADALKLVWRGDL